MPQSPSPHPPLPDDDHDGPLDDIIASFPRPIDWDQSFDDLSPIAMTASVAETVSGAWSERAQLIIERGNNRDVNDSQLMFDRFDLQSRSAAKERALACDEASGELLIRRELELTEAAHRIQCKQASQRAGNTRPPAQASQSRIRSQTAQRPSPARQSTLTGRVRSETLHPADQSTRHPRIAARHPGRSLPLGQRIGNRPGRPRFAKASRAAWPHCGDRALGGRASNHS